MRLYTGATVLTIDRDRRVLTDGALAVDGHTLTAVGPRQELEARYPGAERIELGGGIVLPGLVNTHVHMAQCILRGCSDNVDTYTWLREHVFPLQGNMDSSDAVASARLCLAEMLRGGTTAFIETQVARNYSFDRLAATVADSGIKAILGKVVMERPGPGSILHPNQHDDLDTSLATAREAHACWDGSADGRLRVGLAPQWTGGFAAKALEECAKLAGETGMHINMHFAQSPGELAAVRERFGMGATALLETLGMLGPGVLLVHCTALEDEDVARIGRTGTHVSHNPASNLKQAFGLPPVLKLLQAGGNVGLGTDGGPVNNGYDLLRDLRLVGMAHRTKAKDPTIMPPETVLELATIGGARAMGLGDQIGSLEAGKRADFIHLDTRSAFLAPDVNPVSVAVYGATGRDVDLVVIDGRHVVEGGRLLTMDEQAVVAEAVARAPGIYARAGVGTSMLWKMG